MAATATATGSSKTRIIEFLKLAAPIVLATSLYRSNLKLEVLEVQPHQNMIEGVVTVLAARYEKANGKIGTGIIYTTTRQETVNICRVLRDRFPLHSFLVYHGETSDSERIQVHKNS